MSKWDLGTEVGTLYIAHYTSTTSNLSSANGNTGMLFHSYWLLKEALFLSSEDIHHQPIDELPQVDE